MSLKYEVGGTVMVNHGVRRYRAKVHTHFIYFIYFYFYLIFTSQKTIIIEIRS